MRNYGQRHSVRYLRKNFDELAILTALAKVVTGATDQLNFEEEVVITAFRRSSPKLENAEIPDLQQYLQGFDENQIEGVVSNIKGILHEIEFVEFENHDGDTIQATIFDETNHPGTDVLMHDTATGEQWEVQLKATDDAGYVRDWIENHPDGEILITDELAGKLELASSGESNGELTARVEKVVDRLLEYDDETIWNYVPMIGVASVSIVVFTLWQRYRKGQISFDQFKFMASRASGLKAGKIILLSTLLSIPVLNVATGAYLVARLILTVDRCGSRTSKPFLAMEPR